MPRNACSDSGVRARAFPFARPEGLRDNLLELTLSMSSSSILEI